MADVLSYWTLNEPLLSKARVESGAPLSSFSVHAPVTPQHVYCAIGNYRQQLLEAARDADPLADVSALKIELNRRRTEGEPYIAQKPASAVTDPFSTIAVSREQTTLDWEVELGVVIGLPAHRVTPDEALKHVAGYCTVNDITLRQRLFRAEPKAMGTDFLQAKGQPGWLPVGPWLVPARQIPRPEELRLTLSLNGQQLQNGCVDDMVFTIAEQIAYLSHHVMLMPGDLLCTGSPAGFGSHYGRYLQPGDLLDVEVAGLGRQQTEIVERAGDVTAIFRIADARDNHLADLRTIYG